MTGAVVLQSRLAPAVDRIIEPMLDLAHCSKLNGIVVVGANSRADVRTVPSWLCARCDDDELRPSGWTVRCGVGRLAGTLDQGPRHDLHRLVGFLSPWGMLVVWIDPQEPAGDRKLRSMLEKHGLVIEASTVRECGSAVSAQRLEIKPISKAA